MTIKRAAKKFGWLDVEIEHAINNADAEYDDECIIELANGKSLHCPAFPDDCDYVRIVQGGYEIAYWIYNEWAECPREVMGAIIGAMKGNKA